MENEESAKSWAYKNRCKKTKLYKKKKKERFKFLSNIKKKYTNSKGTKVSCVAHENRGWGGLDHVWIKNKTATVALQQ